MKTIHAWLTSVATSYLNDHVFVRFMIVFMFLVGVVSCPPSAEQVVTSDYRRLFQIYSALVLAVVPDLFVVVINHPHSRRSQLAICLVVIVSATCVIYVATRPHGMRNAAELVLSVPDLVDTPR